MRRRSSAGPALDVASFAEALSRPGIDPRAWFSIGVVSTDEDEPVEFDVERGQPYVRVTLQPSLVPVLCRVAGSFAGNGEGEWNAFVKGDEVCVGIPEGMEDSGCVILGRLSNALDKFPMDSVAGQDPTTNSFSFRRRRTPMIEEVAGPFTWRSAITGSLISIDANGGVTLKDSENSVLQISADVIGFQGPSSPTSSPDFLMQLDLTGEHFVVQVKDAIFSIASSTASPEQSTLSVPGTLTIGTATNPSLEHVATTESVALILLNVLTALGVSIPGPLTGAALAAWVLTPAFSAAFTAAASPLSPTGTLAFSPSLPAALLAAFSAAAQKPQGVGVQLFPGIGCPGLVVG